LLTIIEQCVASIEASPLRPVAVAGCIARAYRRSSRGDAEVEGTPMGAITLGTLGFVADIVQRDDHVYRGAQLSS
jgi:hypothetical protein